MGDIPEATAKAILTAAIEEGRASEMLRCLFGGGTCTAQGGKLVLLPASVFDRLLPASQPAREQCPTCSGSGRVDLAHLVETLDRPGLTGSDHPKVSRVASWTPKKGKERIRVLSVLRDNGQMTAFDVGNLVGTAPNQIGSRFKELRDDYGLIDFVLDPETGEVMTRTTKPGNKARLHQINDLGLRVLRQFERTWSS